MADMVATTTTTITNRGHTDWKLDESIKHVVPLPKPHIATGPFAMEASSRRATGNVNGCEFKFVLSNTRTVAVSSLLKRSACIGLFPILYRISPIVSVCERVCQSVKARVRIIIKKAKKQKRNKKKGKRKHSHTHAHA